MRFGFGEGLIDFLPLFLMDRRRTAQIFLIEVWTFERLNVVIFMSAYLMLKDEMIDHDLRKDHDGRGRLYAFNVLS